MPPFVVCVHFWTMTLSARFRISATIQFAALVVRGRAGSSRSDREMRFARTASAALPSNVVFGPENQPCNSSQPVSAIAATANGKSFIP